MNSGLVKERNTMFIGGYGVQWFADIFKRTRIFIYSKIDRRYGLMSEITLDYIADEYTVKCVAEEKIEEIESL